MKTTTSLIDPVYALVDPISSPLCRDVWEDKYQYKGETYEGMMDRVADAIYAKDTSKKGQGSREHIRKLMKANLWMPAGRILAGAGTEKRVTLLNCFVNGTLEDDMESITVGLANIMLTQQQGGGIGTDFSPLRPPLARLHRTGASASGPGPFMDTWDSACTTIRSTGDRRGAMMGTLICTHPFLPEFIRAKHEPGKWTNFNVSVLVTDAFMSAVQEDEEWTLHHPAMPNFERPAALVQQDFRDDDDVHQYAYSVHRARDLWDQMMRSTYEYAEPGVIFIDRVNDMNNLAYVEEIMCTNPCGEQPLPPHGCCDLGAANISRMVRNPFTEDAEFDWELLKLTVREGVRFLDNVIDVTNYPLEAQRDEEFNKRRIGLGISGLADAMHFLGMRYGSVKSLKFTEQVMRTICIEAYWASVELAKEKGSFPLFDTAKYCARPFIESLPEDLQAAIREHGIRNGVLLTIAPTGTTSIAYGNGSSGLEPVFAHSMNRKVRQADGSFLPYEEVAFGARLYLAMNPDATLDDLPSYMNVCNDVKVHEHIRIQEVCQRWVDASISKTINLPKEISYEDFKDVYQQAYDADCKGCTTYRPSDVRGSILEVSSDTSSAAEQTITASKLELVEVVRPDTIQSRTTKIRWNGLSSALYLTIGYVNGKPFEVFLNSKDQKAMEWTMGLTLLMSMCLRKNIPLATIADEFQKIASLEGSWAVDVTTGKGRYWPSLIAYLGHRMEHLADPEAQDAPVQEALEGGQADQVAQTTEAGTGTRCDSCGQMEVHKLSGCDTCANCGWSKCG